MAELLLSDAPPTLNLRAGSFPPRRALAPSSPRWLRAAGRMIVVPEGEGAGSIHPSPRSPRLGLGHRCHLGMGAGYGRAGGPGGPAPYLGVLGRCFRKNPSPLAGRDSARRRLPPSAPLICLLGARLAPGTGRGLLPSSVEPGRVVAPELVPAGVCPGWEPSACAPGGGQGRAEPGSGAAGWGWSCSPPWLLPGVWVAGWVGFSSFFSLFSPPGTTLLPAQGQQEGAWSFQVGSCQV